MGAGGGVKLCGRCRAPPTLEPEVPRPAPHPAHIGAGSLGPAPRSAPAPPTSNICGMRIPPAAPKSRDAPFQERGERAGWSLGKVLDGADLGSLDLQVQLPSRALKMLCRPPGTHHPCPPYPSPVQEFHCPALACNFARLTHAPTPIGSGMSPGLPLSSRAAPTHLLATPGPGCGDGLCFPAAL